jgi:FMN hydrolase / 5-amino-6-(5-phospho-D-ribitylamino)uracil phosphatase
VRAERADLAHDPYAARVEALRGLLREAGEDPALADGAVVAVDDARQVVELHPEVPAALDRLAARFPLVAVTNGTADLERTGVARWFEANVAAPALGIAKPAPAIFHRACDLLGLPPGDVLHAGDDLALDVGGALAAGLQAAWVHRDLAGDAPAGALRCPDLTALAEAVGA